MSLNIYDKVTNTLKKTAGRVADAYTQAEVDAKFSNNTDWLGGNLANGLDLVEETFDRLTCIPTYSDRGLEYVTVNGICDLYDVAYFLARKEYIHSDFYEKFKGKEVILSGVPQNNIGLTVQFYSDVGSIYCHGNEEKGTIPLGASDWNLCIFIPKGVQVDNIKVYPMVRLATDSNSVYRPYNKSNAELTNELGKGIPYKISDYMGSIANLIAKTPVGSVKYYYIDISANLSDWVGNPQSYNTVRVARFNDSVATVSILGSNASGSPAVRNITSINGVLRWS